MKLLNACSFATLRISALLAMLWALPVAPVSADPIRLTSGEVTPFGDIRFTFPFVDFDLEGPGFSLSGNRNFLFEYRFIDDCPVPSCPTAIVNLSLNFLLLGPIDIPTDQLHYNGEFYVATGGGVSITTVSTMIGPRDEDGAVTLPFTLTGGVHGESPTAGSIDLGFVGGGTVRAAFFKRCFPPGDCGLTQWTLFDVHYDLEPIPEPTTWLLLGSGLLGYATRRRSTRRSE